MLFAPIPVELDLDELALVDFVAHHRSAKGWPQGAGKTGDRLSADLFGTACECAGCKGLGLIWDPYVDYIDPHLPDARWHIQIRGAPPWGRLIVRPKDDPRDDFVLVWGAGCQFQICGWLSGYCCRDPRYFLAPAARPAAYFVPRSALHRDMTALLAR